MVNKFCINGREGENREHSRGKDKGERRGGGDGGMGGTTDGWDQTEHGEQVCVS